MMDSLPICKYQSNTNQNVAHYTSDGFHCILMGAWEDIVLGSISNLIMYLIHPT
jgi:hypothetical protein